MGMDAPSGNELEGDNFMNALHAELYPNAAAEAAARDAALNAQRSKIKQEKDAVEQQMIVRQNQYNQSIRRSFRGRIRGGIFGEGMQQQPPGQIGARLG